MIMLIIMLMLIIAYLIYFLIELVLFNKHDHIALYYIIVIVIDI